MFFGSGVSLNTVQGVRDKFLDLQLYRETAKQTGATERYFGVDSVSSSLGDTGIQGIAAQIQGFFQGFQSLAAQPEDTALRTNVVGKAQTMITGLQFQHYSLLDDQRNNADQAVSSLVTEINTLTSQIARLNEQIVVETGSGGNNDARDQRKSLTDKLSELVGINVFERPQIPSRWIQAQCYQQHPSPSASPWPCPRQPSPRGLHHGRNRC